MVAPRGSVIEPESVAEGCVWAEAGEANEITIRDATEKIKRKKRTEVFMRIPLSRLAREVKVVRVSGIVSGFRGCGLRRSPGSAVLRRAAFPPRNTGQWLARNYSALQSRVGDGFAPSSRHGVSGGCGEGFRRRGLAGTLQSSG